MLIPKNLKKENNVNIIQSKKKWEQLYFILPFTFCSCKPVTELSSARLAGADIDPFPFRMLFLTLL